jgi:hypothetical protein
VLSKGFEIETEMSIHAVDKNLMIDNVIIDYKDRPVGSESKLNTYSDGCKVLVTILRLFRNYKPLGFFGILSLLLILVATGFMIPVVATYVRTGLVPDFPTLIVCGFAVIAAIQSFFGGLILSNIAAQNRRNFEYELLRIREDQSAKE